MNSSIRKVALGIGLAFTALLANLNFIQLARSDHFTNHPRNDRPFYDMIGRRRGEILAADGTVIAESYRVRDPRYRFRRRYPLADLFGYLTGYYGANPRLCRPTGLEATYGDVLVGDEPDTAQSWVDDLLGRERTGNQIQITIDPKVQRVARRALAAAVGSSGEHASVAAIDPRTGGVRALLSSQTYDPNVISTSSPERCGPVIRELQREPGNPLLFRATQERFPPGSTMKTIVSAAALEAGMTPSSSVPVFSRYTPPGTDRSIGNFTGGACPSPATLDSALSESCNTAFAYVGAERVRDRRLHRMAIRFGFDRPSGLDIQQAALSCYNAIPAIGCSDDPLATAFVAQSSIGQYNVRVTALQMASVAATVANGGFLMRPYLVDRILDAEGAKVGETEPVRSSRIYAKRTAEDLQQMMVNVVRFGTGARVGFSSALRVGGKTGTAQAGVPGEPPHVWFLAWHSKVAVAVVVEHGGRDGFNATGGGTAGPVARAVLEAVLDLEEGDE